MKIVVIGADGPVGARLVTCLHERGHETVAALADASVVVDVSNASDTSTRNLLAAAAAAGLGHHVALTDDGSVAELIRQSSIPYSIVRTTPCAGDVASVLARIAVGPPVNGVVTVDHS